MIRDWEERLNARQVVAQIQADMFDEHGLSCPNCRQFNAKVSVRLDMLRISDICDVYLNTRSC